MIRMTVSGTKKQQRKIKYGRRAGRGQQVVAITTYLYLSQLFFCYLFNLNITLTERRKDGKKEGSEDVPHARSLSSWLWQPTKPGDRAVSRPPMCLAGVQTLGPSFTTLSRPGYLLASIWDVGITGASFTYYVTGQPPETAIRTFKIRLTRANMNLSTSVATWDAYFKYQSVGLIQDLAKLHPGRYKMAPGLGTRPPTGKLIRSSWLLSGS